MNSGYRNWQKLQAGVMKAGYISPASLAGVTRTGRYTSCNLPSLHNKHSRSPYPICAVLHNKHGRSLYERDQHFLLTIAARAAPQQNNQKSRLDNSYIYREESDLAIRLARGAV